MTRKVGIIAYGTVEDRARLEALAKMDRRSASQWIIDRIRKEYEIMFGKDKKDAG